MLLGESYWPVRRTPVPRRRLVCSSLRPWPWSRLNAQFYQAGPAPIAGTTTCPESPCLTLALPLSGRRVPSPPRPLLLVHRSYRLIRQSYVALLYFGSSLVEGVFAGCYQSPAATRTFPTLFLQIFPVLPEPVPRRVPLSAFAWFFLNVYGLPKKEIWSAFLACLRERDFSAGLLSRLQLFRYVQASQFA